MRARILAAFIGGFNPDPLAEMEREQSRWWRRFGRWALALLLAIALLVVCLVGRSHARDLDGRYANSPLKAWFEQLKSGRGLCCSYADGFSVSDVDWDTKDGHYRVRLDGEWTDVPEAAVIQEPNRFGPAVVWPIGQPGAYQRDEHNVIQIRCFLPGAGA